MSVKIKSSLLAGVSVLLMLSMLAGCSLLKTPAVSPSPSPSAVVSPAAESPTPTPTPTPSVSKADIQKYLDSQGENSIIDIKWSPDDSMAVYIKNDDETGKVYVWKVNTAEAQFVAKAEGTTDGFMWAPDSKHFLIEVGHMGPGTVTSDLVDSESLSILAADITTVNVSPPVWSPDGRFLALSTLDESTNDIAIQIYAVASNTSVSVLESNNKYGPYVVESWINDTVTYTTVSSTGERTESSLLFGE